ncbi:3-oxoacyl-ACP synthase III [Microlunatus elymi]|uniref:3-oxoacyl-ACP synthase III n=1 Tax=Microlunatus elymi TaxID=2596828 RepID=A0A516PWD2_9ACTN|nr:3-oxoacyl-ACP synthase III [Microlunatus elymi]QDP95452.1 3-oxoacyl-ACP synthase III [Microlunatus elymi]
MSGNATYRLTNTSMLSVSAIEAPVVATSEEFDDRLEATYRRTGLRRGMLEALAGVRERRWWPDEVSFADAASLAGAKALAEAGITPSQVGVLISTAVTRPHLEPSSAVAVHHQLGLPTNCFSFDIANACLGFLNGIQVAGMMIDSGQVDYALLVDAEAIQKLHRATLDRLEQPDATAAEVKAQFASLTIGSGAAAMVLGRTDQHPEGHRILGGVSRSGSEHHELCVGDLNLMQTDSRALFEAGIRLAIDTWNDAAEEFDWSQVDYFFCHQTSVKHIAAMAAAIGVSPDRCPTTVEEFGNLGAAAVPFTLARNLDRLQPGMRVMLLGIGSGLNTSFAEIAW